MREKDLELGKKLGVLKEGDFEDKKSKLANTRNSDYIMKQDMKINELEDIIVYLCSELLSKKRNIDSQEKQIKDILDVKFDLEERFSSVYNENEILEKIIDKLTSSKNVKEK